jgi:hypothetical protein
LFQFWHKDNIAVSILILSGKPAGVFSYRASCPAKVAQVTSKPAQNHLPDNYQSVLLASGPCPFFDTGLIDSHNGEPLQ